MKKLPIVPKSHIIGNKAAKLLEGALNEICIVNSFQQNADYGIDFGCILLKKIPGEKAIPTERQFNLQCKGMKEIKEEEDFISVQIKVKTINYWFLSPLPTFLFIVDTSSKKIYWVHPINELNKRTNDWGSQESVTFKIPKSNSFGLDIKKLPDELIKNIDEYKFNKFEQNLQQDPEYVERVYGFINKKKKATIASKSFKREHISQSHELLKDYGKVLLNRVFHVPTQFIYEDFAIGHNIINVLAYPTVELKIFNKGKTPQIIGIKVGSAKSNIEDNYNYFKKLLDFIDFIIWIPYDIYEGLYIDMANSIINDEIIFQVSSRELFDEKFKKVSNFTESKMGVFIVTKWGRNPDFDKIFKPARYYKVKG